MSARTTPLAGFLLFIAASVATPTSAHRLDEYLQATLISVDNAHVRLQMRLIPGVAVSDRVLALIDTNADGVVSKKEQHDYAERVLSDLSVKMDGVGLQPHVIASTFPEIQLVREGLGEIRIEIEADLPLRPRGPTRPQGPTRTLAFENHHLRDFSVYLTNVLVPQDPDTRVTSQRHSENQASFEVDLAAAQTQTDGFATLFRLGMAHIAAGTDHLLFLLALLLPAPLIAARGRWRSATNIRHSLVQIGKVVTAFTIGHSITLALATFAVLRPDPALVEILIAASVLVSAIHALKPLFPGREPLVAALFGLVHGMAFAATLDKLAIGGIAKVVDLLGFNLGIEAMQLIIVCVAMPLLLLASRTDRYPIVRIAGGALAAVAAIGWIIARLPATLST